MAIPQVFPYPDNNEYPGKEGLGVLVLKALILIIRIHRLLCHSTFILKIRILSPPIVRIISNGMFEKRSARWTFISTMHVVGIRPPFFKFLKYDCWRWIEFKLIFDFLSNSLIASEEKIEFIRAQVFNSDTVTLSKMIWKKLELNFGKFTKKFNHCCIVATQKSVFSKFRNFASSDLLFEIKLRFIFSTYQWVWENAFFRCGVKDFDSRFRPVHQFRHSPFLLLNENGSKSHKEWVLHP